MTAHPFAERTLRTSFRAVAAGIAAYLLLLIAIAVFVSVDADTRMVLWPIAVDVVSVAGLVLVIRRRDRAPSYFEVGVLYAGIVALYAAFPPLLAVLNRFQFSPLRDNRFAVGQPTPSEVATIAWWYAIFLAVFCAGYLLIRPRHSVRREPVRLPGRALPIAAAILLLVAKLFDVVVFWFFDLHPQTYSEQYIAARSLPVFWRQMLNIFGGMEITLQIVILASLFCYYRRTKWVIVIFVAALVGATILQRGQRTEMAIVVIVAMQLRDLLVKRISARTIAIAAAAGFVAFLTMGVLRQESGGLRVPTIEELSGSTTDFEGIFDNAWDLKYVQGASGAFRGHPSLLFADIISILPQQVLPFAKTSAALWYVQTYYPAVFAAGGGLVFGVVSEAVVGYGPVELVVRGLLIALMLGLAQRFYVRGRIGVISLSFYTWITIMSYLTCRNTALAIVSQTFVRFVPAVVATLLLAAALRGGRAIRQRIFTRT